MTETRSLSTLRRAGIVGAAAGALALVAGAGALSWLLLTASGAQFVLERLLAPWNGKVGAVEGRLAGPLAVASLDLDSPALRVRATRVALDWSPSRLVKGELRVDRLVASALDIETAPSGDPPKPPASLELPLRVVILHGGLDRLRVASKGEGDGGVVLRDLTVQGVAEQWAWIVQSARAATPWGNVKLAGTLGTAAPFAIDARGEMAGARDSAAYRASVAATGALTSIEARFSGVEGGLSGTGTATVAPFDPQPLRKLVARLEGLDLAAFAAAPKTKLTVEADLVPRDGALLAGEVKLTNAAAGPWDRDRLPVESAAASIRVVGDRIEVRSVDLRLAGGGSARGEAAWAAGRLEARVVLKDADLLALHTALRATRLSGSLEATVTGEGQSITLAVADPRFVVAGEARIADGVLTVAKARLSRGPAIAEGSGKLALKGSRDFEAAGRVEHLDPAAFAKVPAGDLNGSFAVRGRIAQPGRVEARVEIAASRYAGLPAQGRAAFVADPGRISQTDVDLAFGASRLIAKGALGRVDDALEIRAASPDLAQLGRPFGLGLGGRVDLQARVAGAFAAPALRAALEAVNLHLPGDLRVATVSGNLDVGAGEASAATGDFVMMGLAREGEKEPLVSRAALALKGTRAAHDLRLEGEMPDKTALRALLSGGIVTGARAPEWRGRLEGLETTGVLALALAAPAPLLVSAERIELGEAMVAGEPGQARLSLTRWTPAAIEARGSLRGLFLRSLTRILGLQGRLGSTLVMDGEWDIRMGETLDGFVALQRVQGDVRIGEPRQSLGLESLALRAEASGGRLKASLDLRGKQAGQWQGELGATLRRGERGWEVSPVAPLDGRFSVDVPDVSWMAAWMGPEASAAGRLKGSGTLAGTPRDPQWNGRLEATGLAIREPATGAEVADGTIAVVFRDREARIERFELSAPWKPERDAARALAAVKRPVSGEVTAQGAFDLAARKGTVNLKASAFPLTRLATRFLAVSGEGRVDFDGQATALAGSFGIDAGWIGIPASAPPALSDDVIVVRGPRQREEAPMEGTFRLDLRVGLGDNLYFEGRGVSTRLAGNLRLAGEIGPNLRTTGTIRAEGGTYVAYGRTLALERGALNFVGPVDNPGLNILALRKGLAVEAGVEITGTVNRPRTRLVSSPDVPEPEKLSWLVLGRGQGDVSAADAATLIGAADEILGREVLPAAKIISGLGIDQISVGRDEKGVLGALPESTVAGKTSTASAAEVLTVGKRLSDKIYVSYRQGLADAEGSLRIAYQFSKSLQFILQAGDRPGVDAAYRFSLDDVPKLVK